MSRTWHSAAHRSGTRSAMQPEPAATDLGFDDIPPSEAIPSDVIDLARSGDALQAIRRLRKLRGLGLLQAKRVVDAIEAGEG
jgi:ribosomal protein L7/L12